MISIFIDEPCLPANYKTINQWERSVGNLKGGQICDNILKPGWYRPVSLAGNAMPTDCQKNGLKCGTMFPIWMNGKYCCLFFCSCLFSFVTLAES